MNENVRIINRYFAAIQQLKTDKIIRGLRTITERVVLLAISAAGHFHTTEKAATPLIRRAIASGFLTKCGGNAVKLSL